MASSDIWLPENYAPRISTEKWLELLSNNEVCKEECLIALRCLKDIGGAATCRELSSKYGRHSQFYNLACSRLAKRVALKTGCPVIETEDGKKIWWPVLFTGQHADVHTAGSFIWKLRPELAEALNLLPASIIAIYDKTSSNEPYQLAAAMLMEIAKEKDIDTEKIFEESEQERLDFLEKFSPEKLLAIPDDKLLDALFLTQPSTKDYMMNHLEKKTKKWGGISGGAAFKFGLFQREKDKRWLDGNGHELTDAQAVEHAMEIRDKLVQGSQFFENAYDGEDINAIDKDMESIFGKSYANIWILKYFALLYPDILSGFYNEAWQNHVLYACNIFPAAKPYARSAQIAMISACNNWHYPQLYKVFTSCFGQSPIRFYRLDSEIDGQSNLDEWKENGVVALGWHDIGPLETDNGKIYDNKLLAEKLEEEYYPQNKSLASKKARELAAFYNADASSVFIVMSGKKPFALVDKPGKYFFVNEPLMPHCRPGTWHMPFAENERLPNETEGLQSFCVDFKSPANLVYLYKKYYQLDKMEVVPMDEDSTGKIPEKNTEKPGKLNFKLCLPSSFNKNRIIFGAPGTGKSHRLKMDSEEMFQGNIERVTFHPDYAYSHFMGCYKPQTTEEGNIRYAFVPGPFLRVLAKALRSGMENNPQPFLLIIEEINRARVTAVFGDAFQLLDRIDNEYSEYNIAVSEDVKGYLSHELGCSPDDCARIRIPGNMHIWATMNSADQGVSPMDTAFKRRWAFEYMPIDPEGAPDVLIPVKTFKQERHVSWNRLRCEINNILSVMRINEDKLIGPYFIKPAELPDDGTGKIKSDKDFNEIFKNKILMYLFERVSFP